MIYAADPRRSGLGPEFPCRQLLGPVRHPARHHRGAVLSRSLRLPDAGERCPLLVVTPAAIWQCLRQSLRPRLLWQCLYPAVPPSGHTSPNPPAAPLSSHQAPDARLATLLPTVPRSFRDTGRLALPIRDHLPRNRDRIPLRQVALARCHRDYRVAAAPAPAVPPGHRTPCGRHGRRAARASRRCSSQARSAAIRLALASH